MKLLLFVLLLITLSASLLHPEKPASETDRFVVWNIGQGQWTTMITQQACDHYDMGGEFDLSAKVLQACSGRIHRLHLSHWDWDHMSFVQKWRKRKIPICLWNSPIGNASERKKILLEGLPHCADSTPYELIFAGDIHPTASSNDTSQVVMTHGILIPGDSTKKEELHWSRQKNLKFARGLILGHHGSRTSTSVTLLSNLPNLRWAIATARHRRYGHPHAETLALLRKNKTPVLKTEDWGSIIFEF